MGKEFEVDLINQKGNHKELCSIFTGAKSVDEMIKIMTDDKLNSIISVCNAIDNGAKITIPDYINGLIEWINK